MPWLTGCIDPFGGVDPFRDPKVRQAFEEAILKHVHAIDFSFESAEGHVFDGRIETCDLDPKNGYGVVLIGGGLASDQDWTVPGDYTIFGEATRDARQLSLWLASRGYVVMRWNAIRRDDPLHAENPLNATAYSYPKTLEHARLALKAFRDQKLVADDHIILIGHSLGARRACHIAENDSGIAGLVLLAGSQLAQSDYDTTDLRRLAGGVLGEMDWSGDGLCSENELLQWQATADESPLKGKSLERMDRDGDGVLVRWEIAAQLALNDRATLFSPGSVTRDHDRLPYAEDILSRSTVPVLAIYGSLDDIARNGVLLCDRLQAAHRPNFEIYFMHGLGHCLGPEEAGRTGPMSDEVIRRVIDWIDRLMGARESPSGPSPSSNPTRS